MLLRFFYVSKNKALARFHIICITQNKIEMKYIFVLFYDRKPIVERLKA